MSRSNPRMLRPGVRIRRAAALALWAWWTIGSIPPVARAATPGPIAAFLGGDAPSGAGAPELEAGAIYLAVGPGTLRPTRLDVRDTEPVRDVRLSPALDRIAYIVMREVSCDPSYSVRVPFAVVVDTNAEEVVALPGVTRLAWSPEGDRLAVVYGRTDPAECPPDSIAIVALKDRSGTTYPMRPLAVEWLDTTTLLLEGSGITAFSVATGSSKKVMRGGPRVSPDGRYSFATGGGPPGLRLSDDRSHADLTRKVAKLLGEGTLAAGPAPFWVRRDGAPHALCVPARRPGGESASYLMDAEGPKLIRIVPGAAVASTPDGRSMLVYRDGQFRFEDL